MSRLAKEKDQLSKADSMTSNSSFIITDKQLQRAKKKKKAAFQSFLSKPQPDPSQSLQPKRKLSDHQREESGQILQKGCVICSKIMSQKVKVCQFCRQTICITHFRKARKNPNTNKFSRICDLCEDKYLMEKHYRNQMKTEETIVSEEEVLSIKYNKAKTQVEEKKQALAQLKEKNRELAQVRKRQINSIVKAETEISKQMKMIYKMSEQNRELQKRLGTLQSMKPPSLENDYKILSTQRQRISKDLHKIKRQVEHAQKTKSQLQKKMYQDLYEWQLMQKYKLRSEQKKKEQCIIY